MKFNSFKVLIIFEKPKLLGINNRSEDPSNQNTQAQFIEIIKYNYQYIYELATVKPMKCYEYYNTVLNGFVPASS